MIYFDNSATTPLAQEVKNEIISSLDDFGNPSSRHKMGMDAEKFVQDARKVLSKKLSCSADEVYFTSGGTESDNISVFGSANIKKGKRIVTTSIEHPAVGNCMNYLEEQGFEVIRIKPDKYGHISADDILNAVTKDTSLVSCMHVNNETGAIMDVERLKKGISAVAPRALLHVDAVQSFGHIPFKPDAWGIDLASISSHKIHGPKGIGALYMRKGVSLKPHVFGGGQEKNIRSGTENTLAIRGFSRAVELINDEDRKRAGEIKEFLKSELLKIPGTHLNGGENDSPFILNISFGKIRSEILLNALSNRGIYVSSGSACASGKHTSHVLKEMSSPLPDSAIRFSLSRYNTMEEAERAVGIILEEEKGLRR